MSCNYVNVNELTITDGEVPDAARIHNAGDVVLKKVTVTNTRFTSDDNEVFTFEDVNSFTTNEFVLNEINASVAGVMAQQ